MEPEGTSNVKAFLVEHQVPGRGLGRSVVEHDPRSRDYPVAEVLPRSARARSARASGPGPWWRRGIFDQGSESSCTFQTQAGLLVTSRSRMQAHVRRHLSRLDSPAYRYEGYRLAQTFDPWPGAEPDYYGTSTLAAFKAVQALGLVPEGWEYRWIFGGASEVCATLNTVGPVAIGVPWYESMDHPKPDGTVEVAGDVRGGHAVELLDDVPSERCVTGVNSWGPGYGIRGRFRIPYAALDRLLAEDGEAATWVVR